MALFNSLRRGALQQQSHVQGLLGEHRLLGVRFLRSTGRKKKDAEKDSVKPTNAAIDTASGATNQSWANPFSKVVNLVDKKLDYFRPAHAQSGTKSKKKAGGKAGSVEKRGSVGGQSFGDRDAWKSHPPPDTIDAFKKAFGGKGPGSGARSKGLKWDDNHGNGFGSGGGGSSSRLYAGAKRVLEDASKELQAAVWKRNLLKKTAANVVRVNSLNPREAEKELAAAEMISKRAGKASKASTAGKAAARKSAGAKPAGGKLTGGKSAGGKLEAGKKGAGQLGATSKKGKKKGKAELDTERPRGNKAIRLAREDLEEMLPGFSTVSPALDWNEAHRVGKGREPWDATRVERDRRLVAETGRKFAEPEEVTRKGREKILEAASTEGPERDPLDGGGRVPVTRRGRKKKVTDGTVAKKSKKELGEEETAKNTQKRTPKSSALSEVSTGSHAEASSSSGEAVSEDGLVRIAPKSLGDLTPSRSRKTAAVSAEDVTVSPLPESRQLYTELKEREREGKPGPLAEEDSSDHEKALAVLTRFTERGWASDQALALYVNHELYPVVAARFKDLVLRGCTDDLAQWFRTMEPSDAAEEALFPLFAELCLQEFRAELRQFRKLVESANLTEPEKWYPYARAMKRKIVYHCGPTNSGKTYEALQRLKKADNGLYCGPLRLLAMEIFDTLNADGVYCNLTTGQERRTVPFANHTSCTVEMAHLGNEYEVAVIDEIQMMADDHRGWAWTRALLGLQAKEIHVCGDSSVLKMLQDAAETCGDEFVVRHYERWKPLSVEDQALGGTWRNVTEGDCVVAFSRKEIFRIKEEIEAQGNQNCCVIYGALPPETRRQQAKLFNDPDSDYKVLVASDAIGMGLNLNIRRMVFSTMEKFAGGTGKETIPTPMVKQIAGRAGRRNSSHPEGLATAYYSADLAKLRDAMAAPMQTANKGGLFPIFEQMELFAGQLPDVRFPALLDKFAETSLLDSSYFLCKHDQIRTIALLLEEVPTLTLRDRFSLCQAPINTRSPEGMGFLLSFAKAYADGKEVPLKIAFGTTTPDILELEWKHQVVSAYLWLSYQLQASQFPHREKAGQLLTSMVQELDRRLADRVNKRSKRSSFFRPKDFSFLPGLGKRKAEEKEREGLSIAAAAV